MSGQAAPRSVGAADWNITTAITPLGEKFRSTKAAVSGQGWGRFTLHSRGLLDSKEGQKDFNRLETFNTFCVSLTYWGQWKSCSLQASFIAIEFSFSTNHSHFTSDSCNKDLSMNTFRCFGGERQNIYWFIIMGVHFPGFNTNNINYKKKLHSIFAFKIWEYEIL